MLFRNFYFDFINDRLINLISIVAFILLIILIIAISNTYPSFGLPGNQGPIGPIGFDGIKGQRGNVGWFKNFNFKDKNITSFSLIEGNVGDPGPQGKRGPIGEQGLTGEPGEIGPFGKVGIEGIKGPIGKQGDPGEKAKPIPKYYLKYEPCGGIRDWPTVEVEQIQTITEFNKNTRSAIDVKVPVYINVPAQEAICNPATPILKYVNKKYKKYQCCGAQIINT